jgi:hypothetical protein
MVLLVAVAVSIIAIGLFDLVTSVGLGELFSG